MRNLAMPRLLAQPFGTGGSPLRIISAYTVNATMWALVFNRRVASANFALGWIPTICGNSISVISATLQGDGVTLYVVVGTAAVYGDALAIGYDASIGSIHT